MSVYGNYDMWWREDGRDADPRIDISSQPPHQDMRAHNTLDARQIEIDRRRELLTRAYIELSTPRPGTNRGPSAELTEAYREAIAQLGRYVSIDGLTRNETVQNQFYADNFFERDGSNFYYELVLSNRTISNIQKDTNLTYNQLSSYARRKIERKIESLYAENSESILTKIEAMRLLLLIIADTRSFFNSTAYDEPRYITPNSWMCYVSGLRALAFLETIAQLLVIARTTYANDIGVYLDEELEFLAYELEDAMEMVKHKLYLMEENNLAFRPNRLVNSNQSAPFHFFERDTRLTWIEQRIMPHLNASTLNGANHYDTFPSFRTPVTERVEERAPLPVTTWEVLTDAESRGRGLGLRVNGVTLRGITGFTFDSEPGGVTRLSIQALIVPGQSTLSFSSQLSDTIQTTEGNALPVDTDRVQSGPNERFIDL
jgi:hypothetical protein